MLVFRHTLGILEEENCKLDDDLVGYSYCLYLNLNDGQKKVKRKEERRGEKYKLLEYANYIRLEEEKNCFFAVIKIHEKKTISFFIHI